MHEVLRNVPAGGRVLDLGCRQQSFPSDTCPLVFVTRLDLERPANPNQDVFVQADAGHLPFTDHCFDAVIANHSLEHMLHLPSVFVEIGRVLKTAGAVYIAVPDSATFSDRLYRWIYHGGGHINRFRRPNEIIGPLKAALGEAAFGVRLLRTSFGFLERRHFQPRTPRRMWLFLNGRYGLIAALGYICRVADRAFKTRLSVYGWAIYFGTLSGGIDTTVWSNVCVQCGAAHPSEVLESRLFSKQPVPFLKFYTCPTCGAWNFFTNDF